jgi:hypothetical protein
MENREPVTSTVRIQIEGGVASVIRKDKGVKLVIVDMDGDEGKKTLTYESWNKMGRSPQGKKYRRFVTL